MKQKALQLKYACYLSNVTMSAVANLSPVLFLTFRALYGISYSSLGLLVLINFVTQLAVDLIFSLFSHKFNIPKTVKSIPVIAAIGFLIYGAWPFFAPDSVYTGLVLGTLIFSAATRMFLKWEPLASRVLVGRPREVSSSAIFLAMRTRAESSEFTSSTISFCRPSFTGIR